jgi:serine/threonine-protein kinase
VGITAHGALYIVTDHNAGGSLQKLLQKEVLLQEERALNIFIQIAEALAYAHTNGRTHRNLKPGNIILDKTASGHDIVKISDFGIAKSISDHSIQTKATIDQIAKMIGNPNYMSPEQCVDDELDERTDIYSLGCIMYEAVTGKPPFCNGDVVRVMVKHLSETPCFPVNTRITATLKQIIMRCLKKTPAARYGSARELLLDLQNLNDEKLSRQICSVSPPQFPNSVSSFLSWLRTSLLSGQSKRVF